MTRFVTLGSLLLVICLLCPLLAQAQTCRRVKVNAQGIAGADIPISTTAVAVLAANTTRCEAIIYNNSANDMRCADVDKDAIPTPSTGYVIAGGKWLVLGLEGQNRWQCIRAGAADATASVAEALP